MGADQGGAGTVGPRDVSFHPAADKDLRKLDATARRQVGATVDSLAEGSEGLQTHALNGPLKGWNSTKASRGHRIIHRNLDDGTLHVGYIGLHDYDKAITRLTSLTATAFFTQATTGTDNEGHEVELDLIDGWQHADGSVSHDDGTTVSDHPVKEAVAVDNSGGVMVAFVPPPEIAEQLAREDGQPADDLHITLAYLGKASSYTEQQLQILPQIVSSWALRHQPAEMRVGGTGKFNNSHKGQHVLYAAMDIPDGAALHADLVRTLEGHGYTLPSEHGWTPHMTLAYVDRHFRFMPHLDDHRWTSTHVVTEVGTTRHQARLGTIPSGRHTL
ncbi:2'-5' RNA ligase/mRNA-degrading endonuclease RelE of RelBE toxin-antitoxin system [Streptomyces sp. V3I8]|uniref:2'-5' RNA ligase family protein n=1 Tax=Streptomyces sp. V3I8 TaxID=3042279 RepID=UPI00278115AF|nr:2'-5' RNA ligase family protein [Streptomyces sp. V3I8]MDQ1041467.1 2'-5' RNA ligase/mRNA-degrading endonuclease RelE of RelBE toxin-antitoxin system [Streptomyces sp. V3I8]